MKKKYFLLLALTLTLVACEGDDASANSNDSNQAITANTLENTVEDAIDNTADGAVEAAGNVGQAFETAANNIENQLNTLNFEEATEDNIADVQNALANTREQLAAAYENTDEQTQQTLAGWSQDLEEAETALENGTADALENAQNLLEDIRNNLGS